MREIRQSGSEGGGVGTTGAPYPYPTGSGLAKAASASCNGAVGMAESSPAMMGWMAPSRDLCAKVGLSQHQRTGAIHEAS